jgi:3-oxoacyl-[acyl-carrier-protein] synthase III
MNAYITGFGGYVPDRVVTNEEIGSRVGKTAEWIENASGILERRWAPAETTVADLGVAAGEDCFRRTGASRESVGLMLAASGSAARGFPGPAAEIAQRLGLGSTPALDVPIASAGSLFAVALAMRLVETYGDILVVAAEKMSALIESHPLDPNTAVLFGDGAGAVLISNRPGRWRLLDAALHTDGQFRDSLVYDGTSAIRMNGLSVILQAARKLPSVIREVLAAQGIAAAQVSAFLLHQANLNLLTRVAKSLEVAPEKVFTNVQRYGNTSSASMLIAASEWADSNPPAGPVVLSAFGAGFHWGAIAAASAG